MSFGQRREKKVDVTPPVGAYDVARSTSFVKPHNREVFFGSKSQEKGKESTPAPGQYDGHLTPFGSLK